MITRRTMFAGMAAAIAAPAIIRTPGLIMPIKPVWSGPVTAAEVMMRRLQLMADPPLFYDDDGDGTPTHIILQPMMRRHLELLSRT